MIGIYTGRHGELNFEADFIEQLKTVGWDNHVLHNPTNDDLIRNFRQIINQNNIARLDSIPLSDSEMSQIMDVINNKYNTPVAANVFINGKTLAIKCDVVRPSYNLGDEIYLDIFQSSEVAGGRSVYQIAEQPMFKTGAKYNDRRGDVMLLINGLPLIHIELKASGHDITEATTQIQKYMNENVFVGMFGLVQVFFAMTPEDVVYFANANPIVNNAFIFHWGDMNNDSIRDWQELIKGPNQILSIPEAHQLIAYYTTASIPKNDHGCIENLNAGILMVGRSYQIHAIQNIVRRVKIQRWGTHTPLGGYVWGTTGCGKTLTSYKSGQLITDMSYADKVVFVVDRVELSDQSYSEYNNFARDGEPIVKTRSSHALFKKLLNKKDRLIITSIQKLARINEDTKYIDADDIEKIVNKRIVFIVDEAHRSQFGEMHERVKNTFTNALFIGFTGTPIFTENDKADGMTSETVFGPVLATYTIASGIKDKNVLGFDPKQIRTIDETELRHVVACDKAKSGKTMPDPVKEPRKYRIYKHWYEDKSILEIEHELPASEYEESGHREKVVEDIKKNWVRLSNGIKGTKFHAILATSSIPEAIAYYKMLKALDIGGQKLKVTALFDPNVNTNTISAIDKEDALITIVDDYNRMFGTGYNRDSDPHLSAFKKDITARLSHKVPYNYMKYSEMLDIVIVVDQLLTGFDSKYINTLYLDKKMDTDALIQAISRTNRVYDAEEKPFGIFRYYRYPRTMEQNLEDALRLYCEGDSGAAMVANIDENLLTANILYDEIKQIYDDAGIQDFVQLPQSDAACQAFKSKFKDLKQIVNAMKLQGMNWSNQDDPYVKQLAITNILYGHSIYTILEMRYQDLFKGKLDSKQSSGKPAYGLQNILSEIEMNKIDADYLEEHFRKVIHVMVGDFSDLEKELAITDFEQQLVSLSAIEQTFAKQIIQDINDGILPVTQKTLRELIAEYQASETDIKIKEFANMYHLNVDTIKEIYHDNANHDMQISDILDQADMDYICSVFRCKKLNARGKLNTAIRDFIIL